MGGSVSDLVVSIALTITHLPLRSLIVVEGGAAMEAGTSIGKIGVESKIDRAKVVQSIRTMKEPQMRVGTENICISRAVCLIGWHSCLYLVLRRPAAWLTARPRVVIDM